MQPFIELKVGCPGRPGQGAHRSQKQVLLLAWFVSLQCLGELGFQRVADASFISGQTGMLYAAMEDVAIVRSVVPNLMRKSIVKKQDLAIFPATRIAANFDGDVAIRNPHAIMQSKLVVYASAMNGN
jgi:hypothetical protein